MFLHFMRLRIVSEMRVISAFVLFFIMSVSSLEAAAHEVWLEINRDFDFFGEAKVETEVGARIESNPFQVYLYFYELGISTKFCNHWKMVSGYRHEYQRNSLGDFKNEPIPFSSIERSFSIDRFVLAVRSRLEYEYRVDLLEYRQRARCRVLTERFFDVQAAVETFFIENYGYHELRISFGFVGDYFSIGYLYRNKKELTSWEGRNILRLASSFNF